MRQDPKKVEDATKRLNDFNEQANDWYATCRKCGTSLEGTLQQLRDHKCGVQSNPDT